jgi:hypothetical protein
MGMLDKFRNEHGGVLVLIAFFVVVLIAALAFAVDINHLYVVRNELQNAADAGALAGSNWLYEDPDPTLIDPPGSQVNVKANDYALEAALANDSDKIQVDIDPAEIDRGHWSFKLYDCDDDDSTPCETSCGASILKSPGCFTPDDLDGDVELDPVALWGVSEETLDLMDGTNYVDPVTGEYVEYINAVKVVARRSDTPALAFFAQFLGYDGFEMQAEAVGYIGFSGTLSPFEADAPIVICDKSVRDENDNFTCNIGRMISSSADNQTTNTAGWTDMTFGDPDASGECSGTSDSEVNPLIDSKDGDPDAHNFCNGNGVNTNPIGDAGSDVYLNVTNGQLKNSFNDMKSCWWDNTTGEAPVEMTLPVVECGPNGIGNCPRVVGAVTVNLLMMTGDNVKNNPDNLVLNTMADTADPSFDDWAYDQTDCSTFIGFVGQPQYNVLTLLPGQDGVDDYWDIYTRWDSNGNALSSKLYTEGMARWDCFVDHFQLKKSWRDNDTSIFISKAAPLENQALYFMPDCEPQAPTGETGGSNFGTQADFPVLVE